MSGTKILWGQISIVFLIVLVSVWSGTQWVAFRLGFQPQLGPAWFEIAGWPVYYPPSLFWWWYFYDAYPRRRADRRRQVRASRADGVAIPSLSRSAGVRLRFRRLDPRRHPGDGWRLARSRRPVDRKRGGFGLAPAARAHRADAGPGLGRRLDRGDPHARGHRDHTGGQGAHLDRAGPWSSLPSSSWRSNCSSP